MCWRNRQPSTGLSALSVRTTPLRIALTGATGFVGSQLVSALHARGHSLQLLIRPGKRSPIPVDERVAEVFGTLEDQQSLQALVKNTDRVVHCAASVRGANWQHFYQPNVQGTQNLLAAVNSSSNPVSIKQFLLISSLAAREPQLSWYAESKHLAEQACQQLNHQSCTILRPPAIYGPGDKEMLPLLKMFYRGWALRVTPAKQRLSLINVSDLAACITHLLEKPVAGIFEPSDGEPGDYTWEKLYQIVSNYSGNAAHTIPLPRWALKLIAQANLQLARWCGNKPILSPGKAQELLWMDWTANSQPLLELSDWQPNIRLAEGLQELSLS